METMHDDNYILATSAASSSSSIAAKPLIFLL